MPKRDPLPHAFTKQNNPMRSEPLEEPLAPSPVCSRLYEVDDAELRKRGGRISDQIRDIVRAHLRGESDG